MFEDIINHCITEGELKKTSVLDFTVRVDGNKTAEVSALLEKHGFQVLQVTNRASVPVEDNIGKQVAVSHPVIIAQDVTMKTPLSLYKIAKVVLPKGAVGTITGIDKDAYVIQFDTSLKVDPYDVVEGNLTNIPAYPISSYNLTPVQIEMI